MPFIWNSSPNIPPANIAPAIASTEISYKVHVVANAVNAGGELSYNTPPAEYDIVYELESLNVRNLMTTNGVFDYANISAAFINTAHINQASINTANITNATINIGFFTGTPTANFSMVSKQYVDNAIANISGGSGLDTTANLITTKGDLLVGFAPNTAHRLGVGNDGEVLVVNNSSNLKMRWLDSSLSSQTFLGMRIGTHNHPTLKLSQVLLTHADGIIMEGGVFVPDWNSLVADMTVSGAGGRDSNSAEAADTWYEVWAIRNSSSDARALLLHRMLNHTIDQSWVPTTFPGGGINAVLRIGDGPGFTLPSQRYCTKVSQSFIPSTSNPVSRIALGAGFNGGVISGTPGPRGTEGNVWISIQSDSGDNASGTPIVTSRSLRSDEIEIISETVFVFDTATSLTPGGRYHIVVEGDWDYLRGTQANALLFWGNTAPVNFAAGQQVWMQNVGYNPGGLAPAHGFGQCRLYNVVTSRWSTGPNVGGPADLWFKIYTDANDTALALPAGYNQKCLISYVCNNGSSNLKEYHQVDRTIYTGFEPDWLAATGVTDANFLTQEQLVDPGVPPIACTVQFLGIPFTDGGIISFAMSAYPNYGVYNDLANDYLSRQGNYAFGGSPIRTFLSWRMPFEEHQFFLWKQGVIAGNRLYTANFTF